ncbi:hypothetical protein [Embleya hyalina]|uniref:Uncharacterized protein n=1 Tax=Embleya hyalina TaxID=516124 RepID=A0A401YQZ8_9ACTN|nr:hypothetical protein [Embleya hyalina]GCD97030.1 hypothetical protein EHYA_04717 [Embleya hyalina]
MIVDSGIYLFDYRRFHEEVVPAIRRLHAEGVAEPWLEAVWNRGRPRPTPVPRFTPHLRELTFDLMAGHDLAGALPTELFPRPASRPKRRGEPRRVPRSDVDDHTLPPDHGDWLRVCDLFRVAVEETCLGDGAFMGNVTLPGSLGVCVDLRGLLEYDQDLRTLLEWLESRGDAWRQAGVDCFAGIYGWLDPDETLLLADALDGHPLPLVDAAFSAVEAARGAGVGACTDGNSCPLSAAVLRAVARLATREGRGLLWGLDATPPEGARLV